MSLIVTRAGILDTIQDLGRFGFGNWGINPSGAMDQYALMAANALVGNSISEAAVEMHYPAPSIYFSAPALISVTGADFNAHINNTPIPNWKTIFLPRDSTLSFTNRKSGFRTYLSIYGGFEIDEWLGSKSTNLKINLGGFEGRSLRKDDKLLFNVALAESTFQVFPWTINYHEIYQASSIIKFLPSELWHAFDENMQQEIGSMKMKILPTSDRMGYYFDNEPILLSSTEELLSSTVDFGTIQILPSGKLVCLMADHQTTGGYPRLGAIISADLPRLAQMVPGSVFTLSPASLEEAEKRLFSQQQSISLVASAIHEKLKPVLK
jgi:antagonist of KipI